jgi:hypothetical protein
MTQECENGYKQGREDAAKDVRTVGANVAGFAEFLAVAAENGEKN